MEKYLQIHHTDDDITVTETEYIFRMKRPHGFAFSKGDQSYYTIALIIAGSARYTLGKQTFTVQPGDILFFPKDTGYSARVISKEPWEHIVIAFKTADEAEIRKFPVETVNKVVHGSRFEELFRQAYGVWSQCAFGYKIQTKAIITNILYELLAENYTRLFGGNTALRSLKAAADFIEQNYTRKITVAELAGLSGYSPSHFARVFSQVYGTSPIQYLNQVRIMHAKNLLRTNEYTLSQIAQKCGFANVYYFSRCFKQIAGTTPKNW